jgi:hypothetical protein
MDFESKFLKIETENAKLHQSIREIQKSLHFNEGNNKFIKNEHQAYERNFPSTSQIVVKEHSLEIVESVESKVHSTSIEKRNFFDQSVGNDNNVFELENLVAMNIKEVSLPCKNDVLTPEFLPASGETFEINVAVDEVLYLVQQHDEQISYRYSAVGTLKRLIRRALNSNSFEVGLHEIRCSLPDDPIKIVVMLSKTNFLNWHTELLDRINTCVNEQRNSLQNISSSLLNNDDEQDFCVDILNIDFKPLVNHVISNANLSLSKVNPLNQRVHCTIDALNVEIFANNRADICMLAFLEEVAQIVGKNNLFKRSLLLIRAWWLYEIPSYATMRDDKEKKEKDSLHSFVSEGSFCVMIVAIFNLYHSKIDTPLQALYLFIAEYSMYDGKNNAITLQGIVPFKSQNSNQPALVSPKQGHLIGAIVIEKFWTVFNPSLFQDPIATNNNVLSNSNEEGSTSLKKESSNDKNELFDSSNDTLLSRSTSNSNSNNSTVLMNNTVQYFDKYDTYNIVHPFTHTNMLVEPLSKRKLEKIKKTFHTGASHLKFVLQNAMLETNPIDVRSKVKQYFSNVLQRFGDEWRPDAVGNTINLLHQYQ